MAVSIFQPTQVYTLTILCVVGNVKHAAMWVVNGIVCVVLQQWHCCIALPGVYTEVPEEGMMSEKVKDVIKRLVQDGWIHTATKGSHRQFRHPVKPGRVTVPGKLSVVLKEGTWMSILKQAGLKK